MRVLSVLLAVIVLLLGTAMAASTEPGELDEVYVNRYTGEALAVSTPVTFAVSEADGPTTFCANRYTGQLKWRVSQNCTSAETAVAVDWDGSVTACVNRYTAKLRYLVYGSCTTAEYPVTI